MTDDLGAGLGSGIAGSCSRSRRSEIPSVSKSRIVGLLRPVLTYSRCKSRSAMSSAGVFSKLLCVSFPVLVLFRPRGIDSIYISFHLFQLVFVYTINSLTCKHHKLKVLFLASL